MKKEFNYNFYINRNKEVAYARYGNLINENRCVAGTEIWFDEYWRIHNGFDEYWRRYNG